MEAATPRQLRLRLPHHLGELLWSEAAEVKLLSLADVAVPDAALLVPEARQPSGPLELGFALMIGLVVRDEADDVEQVPEQRKLHLPVDRGGRSQARASVHLEVQPRHPLAGKKKQHINC